MADRRDMGAPESPVGQLALLVKAVADDAIFLLDPDGRVVTWNPGAARLYQYSIAEAVGEPLATFCVPEDREAGLPGQALEAARAEGRFETEAWRLRRNGERFWASVVVTALRNEQDDLVAYGAITRDLTDLREAQRDLELFASSAAHDLQEPLRTITGFAELLRSRHAENLPREGREFLDHIVDSAQRGQRLITDLLAYARTSNADRTPEPVRVTAALEAAIAQMSRALEDVSLAVDVPAEALVVADTRGLSQVLQNLLSNAAKFADADAPAVAVTARRDRDEWIVSVGDNGPGVPEADRERIFRPFEQLRGAPGGTGLGLAIVGRVVARHGGRLGVDAPPEGGSRFWFALPAAD